MKSTIIKIAILCGLILQISPLSTKAEDGGQIGNGGGGVTRAGLVMTFYSANISINPKEKSVDEIPQLKETLDFFINTNLLTKKRTGEIVGALMPSETRSYYDVDQTHFSAKDEARLIAEYARVTGQPVANIVLFAVTDTKSKATILLPNFYKLKKKSEQMAILFHESLWLLNPQAKYESIIKTEVAFQAHIEDPQNPEKIYNFIFLAGSKRDLLKTAVQMDIIRGILTVDGLLTDGPNRMQLTIRSLFENPEHYFLTKDLIILQNERVITAYKLRKKFPNSMFLKFFQELNADEISLQFDLRDFGINDSIVRNLENAGDVNPERYFKEKGTNLLINDSAQGTLKSDVILFDQKLSFTHVLNDSLAIVTRDIGCSVSYHKYKRENTPYIDQLGCGQYSEQNAESIVTFSSMAYVGFSFK